MTNHSEEMMPFEQSALPARHVPPLSIDRDEISSLLRALLGSLVWPPRSYPAG